MVCELGEVVRVRSIGKDVPCINRNTARAVIRERISLRDIVVDQMIGQNGAVGRTPGNGVKKSLTGLLLCVKWGFLLSSVLCVETVDVRHRGKNIRNQGSGRRRVRHHLNRMESPDQNLGNLTRGNRRGIL